MREEELERAAAMMAYIVVRHGPRYAPIFDFLATELEKMRADGDDPVERARRYLQNHSLMAIKGSRPSECDAGPNEPAGTPMKLKGSGRTRTALVAKACALIGSSDGAREEGATG